MTYLDECVQNVPMGCLANKEQKLCIYHKLIKPYTPRHNRKVENSHRKDHNKFYLFRYFSFCDNLNQQVKDHIARSNNRPMCPLGWFSSVESLSN